METNKTIVVRPGRQTSQRGSKNDMDFLQFLHMCLAGWKWYVLSFVVCITAAILSIKTTAPVYLRSASVHIKEDSRRSSIGNISEEFSRLGLGVSGSSVQNEVVAFNSLELAEQVAQELHLDINYTTRSGLMRRTLYGRTLPIKVTFLDLTPETAASLKVRLLPGQDAVSIEEVKTHKGETHDDPLRATFGQPVKTAVGKVTVTRNTDFVGPMEEITIRIQKAPLSLATSRIHKQMEATLNDTRNSVIDITCLDVVPQRAEDILNTCIALYNANWIKDKNELSILTSRFIDERISAIQQELGGVDADIAAYKSANLIANPGQAEALLLSQTSQSDQRLLALNNQIYMCRYLRDHITAPDNAHRLIPANIGIQSTELTTLLNTYNQKLLTRNTYANNSSEKNPLVINLDEELAAQHSVILQSLDNEIRSLTAEVQSSQKTLNRGTSRLSSAPGQQKDLLSMDRQQKVKEALYLFLLQKREENELNQTFAAYNTRVISRPMGSNIPTSPVPARVYFLALFFAFLIPTAVLFLREMLNTKVRGQKDLEGLSIPFVGDIPQNGQKSSLPVRQRKKAGATKDDIIVKQGQRDRMNEAFRMVRSNLNFMLNPSSNETRQVILVTSALSGSGKTFLTANLATVFGIQDGTRVAAIDLDIRKATLSCIVNNPAAGVTDYLGGFKEDWHALMCPLGETDDVHVLPVGHIPPNPAELLQSDRLKTLIEEMKREYDIILLDMPPAEAVADVTIVKHLADITLFVIRTGLADRSLLPILERHYTQKTYNNLTILLNGSKGGQHRYGYGSYGYGYGYGYER